MSIFSLLLSMLVRWVGDYGAFLADALFSRTGLVVAIGLGMALLFRKYMDVIQTQFILSFPWTFLQVRVSEQNLRTPRAMEEVFNILHGAERVPDLYDIYFDGFVSTWLSIDIRGTSEGVTFLFRIPTGVRKLVEAAIYAQYPEAEILEAEDFISNYPIEKMEKTFDLWGTEMTLLRDDAYPLKTYVDFEDKLAEEEKFVDSMSSLTEVISSLNPGEEIWIQILLRPERRESWQSKGVALALKIGGREAALKKKPTRIQRMLGFVGTVVGAVLPGSEIEAKRPSGLDVGALRLTPGETDVVKAIQRNVSKVGFGVAIRTLALGPKGKFVRRTRIPQVLAVWRPYIHGSTNALIPDGRFTTSKPLYGLSATRQRRRKRRLMQRFQRRYFAEQSYVLNVEELATIFHFPVSYVKTPTVEHARARKGEPPPEVPFAPLEE